MKGVEIKTLAECGYFRGHRLNGQVEETHISWVILTAKYAFKFKKPVKLTFLDFSTLARRMKFCQEELRLNRRFSKIYVSVVPVRRHHGTWYLGVGHGEVVDYAVQMRRMVSGKRMDKQLLLRKVSKENIFSLAKTIVAFHKTAEVVTTPFDLVAARSIFNDIKTTHSFVQKRLGVKYASIIRRSIPWSNAFLKSHSRHIQERIDQGYKRDVHGDLHSGNIFLYKYPVLFDCIEFNDSFRQIDVINEIAFFCMDLEAFGQKRLAKVFLDEYDSLLPCMLTKEDQRLFVYYKCCRANVRVKVHAASAGQATSRESYYQHMKALRGYLELMKRYMRLIRTDA